MHIYPDGNCELLKEGIAAAKAVLPEQIICRQWIG